MHKQIGPGLLESAYHSCLTREFTLNALRFSRDVSVPILYKGSTVDCAYRADFVRSNRLRTPEERKLLVEEGKKIAVVEAQGSLYFGSTEQLLRKLRQGGG